MPCVIDMRTATPNTISAGRRSHTLNEHMITLSTLIDPAKPPRTWDLAELMNLHDDIRREHADVSEIGAACTRIAQALAATASEDADTHQKEDGRDQGVGGESVDAKMNAQIRGLAKLNEGEPVRTMSSEMSGRGNADQDRDGMR